MVAPRVSNVLIIKNGNFKNILSSATWRGNYRDEFCVELGVRPVVMDMQNFVILNAAIQTRPNFM